MLSEIEHFAYCPRQWALIQLDQVWKDNESTAIGHIVHNRVDQPESRGERGHTATRSLVVWSDVHALLGRADSVEFVDGQAPFPVEHKSGRRALAPAVMQLAVQAICLEEIAEPVRRGAVWLHGQRRGATSRSRRNSSCARSTLRTLSAAAGWWRVCLRPSPTAVARTAR